MVHSRARYIYMIDDVLYNGYISGVSDVGYYSTVFNGIERHPERVVACLIWVCLALDNSSRV